MHNAIAVKILKRQHGLSKVHPTSSGTNSEMFKTFLLSFCLSQKERFATFLLSFNFYIDVQRQRFTKRLRQTFTGLEQYYFRQKCAKNVQLY